jgi:hypothetical protein
MALLVEISDGRLKMGPATRVDIHRLVREELALCGFGPGQVATLLPRGQRLLAAARGEFTLLADN